MRCRRWLHAQGRHRLHSGPTSQNTRRVPALARKLKQPCSPPARSVPLLRATPFHGHTLSELDGPVYRRLSFSSFPMSILCVPSHMNEEHLVAMVDRGYQSVLVSVGPAGVMKLHPLTARGSWRGTAVRLGGDAGGTFCPGHDFAPDPHPHAAANRKIGSSQPKRQGHVRR